VILRLLGGRVPDLLALNPGVSAPSSPSGVHSLADTRLTRLPYALWNVPWIRLGRVGAGRAAPSGDQMTAVRAIVNWLARSPVWGFVLIFLLAFAVRAYLLTLVPLERYPERFSELGAVARSLVERGQYADPYVLPTGPTAHPLPIYTGLIALLYRLCGLTLTAEYVRCVIIILGYSVSYAMLPWVAARMGVGAPAGVVSGLVGAVIPRRWMGEVHCAWDEQYAAIWLALLLVAVIRRWKRPHSSAMSSLLLGIAWGASFHVSPPFVIVLAGCLVFELWWRRDPQKWRGAAVMVVGVVLSCVPWAWRNYVAFHDFFFIRSNFGLELRMGNHPGAAADIEVLDAREGARMRHPGCNRDEARRLAEIGEREYMRQARGAALDWMWRNPREFLTLTAARFVHFWCGSLHKPWNVAAVSVLTLLAALGARRALPRMTVPQRAALLIPLATFPLIYYLVTYMSRYRVPIDWILLILAGAELWHWIAAGSRQSTSGSPR